MTAWKTNKTESGIFLIHTELFIYTENLLKLHTLTISLYSLSFTPLVPQNQS